MDRDAGMGPGRARGLLISVLRLGDSFDILPSGPVIPVPVPSVSVSAVVLILGSDGGSAPEVHPDYSAGERPTEIISFFDRIGERGEPHPGESGDSPSGGRNSAVGGRVVLNGLKCLGLLAADDFTLPVLTALTVDTLRH